MAIRISATLVAAADDAGLIGAGADLGGAGVRASRSSAWRRILLEPGTYSPAGVEASEVRSNPALSRNCEAPPGDEPGRLLYADGRQLSTEGRFVRQRRRASSADREEVP
jgi:hypothetical protein